MNTIRILTMATAAAVAIVVWGDVTSQSDHLPEQDTALSVDGRHISISRLETIRRAANAETSIASDTLSLRRMAETLAMAMMKADDAMAMGLNRTGDYRVKLAALTDGLRGRPDSTDRVNAMAAMLLAVEAGRIRVEQRARTDTTLRRVVFERERNGALGYGGDRRLKCVIAVGRDSMAAAEAAEAARAGADKAEIYRLMGSRATLLSYVARRGENALTDWAGYGGTKPFRVGHWPAMEIVSAHMIDAPETEQDCAGPLTALVEQELERAWTDSLRRSHDVVIYVSDIGEK